MIIDNPCDAPDPLTAAWDYWTGGDRCSAYTEEELDATIRSQEIPEPDATLVRRYWHEHSGPLCEACGRPLEEDDELDGCCDERCVALRDRNEREEAALRWAR